MSNYNLSQQLNHVNENFYDDDITATVAKGQFIAVTSNTFDEGSSQRTVIVQILEHEAAPGGKSQTNPGLYIRKEGENSVKAVLRNLVEKDVDSNVQNY